MSFEAFQKDAKRINPYKIEEFRGILKLDANENLFLHKKFVCRMISKALKDYDPRLYPVAETSVLKKELSRSLEINPSQLVVASGSDEIIELLFSSMLRECQEVIAISPTFTMYPRQAAIEHLNYKGVDLDPGYILNTKKVLDSKSSETSMIVLCNPNNPTANQFEKKDVIELIDGFDGPVIVDEAYADYGEYSLVKETTERENLIVLRTFSKAYGMAGMRLGYAVANEKIAEILNERYLPPYAVSGITLLTAANLLRSNYNVQKAIQETKKERIKLIETLNIISGVTAFPSSTNFVLFNTNKPSLQVSDMLLKRGILLRHVGQVLGYKNCLRVTVAPRKESGEFLRLLEEVLK